LGGAGREGRHHCRFAPRREAFPRSQIPSLAFNGAGRFSTGMRPFLALALLLAAGPAAAQVSALDDPSIGGQNRYDNCLLLVRTAPQNALNAATDWEKSGGGGGSAVHCQAVAMVALHRYADAGTKLDALARATPNAADRAALYDQAGNAWLLARKASDAQASFTAAITFSPRDADLYLDRARAFALKPDWVSANDDLTAALGIAPKRMDILVLRASARHALGKKTDARADIDLALRLSPTNADALEMRGELKMEAGDQAGAKADWQAVVAQSPRSSAASTARDRLNLLNQPAAQNPATPAKP
jgi:tetratricopeptide (TPR) repeat protein